MVLLLLAAIPAWAAAALKPIEIRRHWATKAHQIEEKGVDELTRNVLCASLEASVIMRNWYTELPKNGRWTPKGAVRNEHVVLFAVDDNVLRFGWWQDQDFEAGTRDYALKIWMKGREKVVMGLRIRGPRGGYTMDEALQAGQKQRNEGSLPVAEAQTTATFDFAGRRLTVPLAEWERGLQIPEDRQWLASVIDEGLMDALESIAVLADREPELNLLCAMVIQPLLGYLKHRCSPQEPSFATFAGKADCDFDAWFGETCSLQDTLNSKLQKQPSPAP
jgi:hypothetical protein